MVPIQMLSAMLNEHQVSEPENLEAGEGSAEFLALFEDAALLLGEGPLALSDIQQMAIEQPAISFGSSINIPRLHQKAAAICLRMERAVNRR